MEGSERVFDAMLGSRRLRPKLAATTTLLSALLVTSLASPHPLPGQSPPRASSDSTERAAARDGSAPHGGAGRQERSPFAASAYLPLDHWAYPILDFWISSGRVTGLSPFVKPYRRLDVARAVEEVRRRQTRARAAFEEEWIARLQRELRPEILYLRGHGPAPEQLEIGARVGGAYRTQMHRDPLRPVLEGASADDRLLEEAFATGWGQFEVAAAGFRVGRHGIFYNDPQFRNGQVVPVKDAPVLDQLGVRVEEGWLELQTRYASVFFGRMYRNWGPPRLLGLTRSSYAYSEDELAYRFGFDRLFLTGSFAALPDFEGDTTRYFSTHRLEARPWDRVVIAVTEAAIHGGPGQPLVFSLVSPLGLWHIARRDGDPSKNMVGQLDLWVRAADGLALYGSLLTDATGRTEQNNFCCQMGGSLGAELTSAARGWIVRGQATALQSLTYRTPRPWEEWSLEGVGLGWDKADLYLFTLEGEWLRPGGLILRPRLDLQILGEGDFRAPRPEGDELIGWPDILIGTSETTFRPSLGGRWTPPDLPLDLEWDLGVNLIEDHGHQPGVSRTPFVGSVRLVLDVPAWRLNAR